MAGKKKKTISGVNANWEAEIEAYDEDCRLRESEYRSHTFNVTESVSSELTDDENEVLTLFLSGVSCPEIAKRFEVEEELITGLLEVIRAKLSLID